MSKQKTAYEMRISDWSSDVCSSDLLFLGLVATGDVGEGDLGLVLVEQLGPRTPERHSALPAALLHPAHEVHPDADEQDPAQDVDQAHAQRTPAGRPRLPRGHDMVEQDVDKVAVGRRGERGRTPARER